MLTLSSTCRTVAAPCKPAQGHRVPVKTRTPNINSRCCSFPPRLAAVCVDEEVDTAAVEFLESLELAEFSSFATTSRNDTLAKLRSFGLELATSAGPDLSKSTFVAKANPVAFTNDVDLQSKEDVLNSLLLAQLAATKKYDPLAQTDDWYRFYTTVLGEVGWVISNLDFTNFNASSENFRMDKEVLNLLASVATGDELAIATTMLDSLGKLQDGDGRLHLFDSSSSSQGKGNFQISTCSMNGTVVQIALGCFYFSASESSERVLWYSYSSSSTHLFKSTQKVLFNLDQYGRVRQTVKDKLGNAANDFIRNLDI